MGVVWLGHGEEDRRLVSRLDAMGDPYIQEEWSSHPWGRRLLLRYRWPGYEAPAWKTMGERDEFAFLELDEEPDGYFLSSLFGVDGPFLRHGFGTELMRRGLELVRAAGGRGIRSHRAGRTDQASSFWGSRSTRSDGDSDYLEGFRRWLDDGGF